MGPTGFTETSVTSYQSVTFNIPEERIYHLHGGENPVITHGKIRPGEGSGILITFRWPVSRCNSTDVFRQHLSTRKITSGS